MAQINKSNEYFNTVLYTGNGSTQSITGVNFQPDVVWIKNRTVARSHRLSNSVSGVGKYMYTDLTNAEISAPASGIQSFDSDGWTMGNDAGMNESSQSFVAWNWLASNTTASNTQGSIASTVSANTTSGFSIVSYTGNGTGGATVGHGLGVTPDMIILKNRSSANGAWNVWHKDLTSGYNLGLHATNAESNTSVFTQGIILDTTITSSVFGFTLAGSNYNVNSTGENFIAYCFAEKKGFSKFGSYTGNGSADGTFVYTGFKPAFLIVKRTDSGGYDWLLYDNKRQVSFNVVDDFLNPNSSSTETTGNANQSLDFLSNGVKFRGLGASSNASGATYIYMAFAENPLVGTNNIPATAR